MLARGFNYIESLLELSRGYHSLAVNNAGGDGRYARNKKWYAKAAYWYKTAQSSEEESVKILADAEFKPLAHRTSAAASADARLEASDSLDVIYRNLGDDYMGLACGHHLGSSRYAQNREWYAKATYWYMKALEHDPSSEEVKASLVFLAKKKSSYDIAQKHFVARDVHKGGDVLCLSEQNILDLNCEVGRQAVLKPDALAEAVRVRNDIHFGVDVSPSLEDKAAAVVYALSQGHPFADANKRTAYLCLKAFLDLNGFDIAPASDDKVKALIGRCADEIPISKQGLSLAFHDLFVRLDRQVPQAIMKQVDDLVP